MMDDRLESMYGYFREKPAEGDPLSELARQSTLGEYFAHLIERAPFYLNDVQVNLVANGEWDHPPDREDLERATRRIVAASFPGVVDRFDESLVAAEYALKPLFPTLRCAQPPANVSRPPNVPLAVRLARVKEACGPAVYEQLVKLNVLDYELLDRARAEVLRRFEQTPDHAARLQSLRQVIATRGPLG